MVVTSAVLMAARKVLMMVETMVATMGALMVVMTAR